MNPRVRKVLDESGVAYRVHFHREMPSDIRTPQDFADALGYEAARVTKTLLLRAADEETFFVALLSWNKRLDMKRLAAALGASRLRMADDEELARRLGYPRHGVTPLGAEGLRVLVDEGLMAFPTILVGAGEVAVEVELSPQALRDITGAEVLPLS